MDRRLIRMSNSEVAHAMQRDGEQIRDVVTSGMGRECHLVPSFRSVFPSTVEQLKRNGQIRAERYGTDTRVWHWCGDAS